MIYRARAQLRGYHGAVGRPKTWDRDDVLERALHLFWSKGYEGTHLQELVEVTGVNRFSLYKEFGGKDGLYQAALEHYLANLGELEQILVRRPLGLGNVRAFFAFMTAHPFHHGCFAVNTVHQKHVVDEAAWRRSAEFVAGGEAGLRSNLAAAQARGELGAATDVRALAAFLTALDMGLLSYRVLRPDASRHAAMLELLDRVLV